MTDFFNRTIDNLRSGPLGPLVRLIESYPRLTAWIVLAVGMNIMLIIEARDVGLLPGQWAALIIATTLVAGLCVWIISWEDEPLEEAEAQATAAAEHTEAKEPSAPEQAEQEEEEEEQPKDSDED